MLGADGAPPLRELLEVWLPDPEAICEAEEPEEVFELELDPDEPPRAVEPLELPLLEPVLTFEPTAGAPLDPVEAVAIPGKPRTNRSPPEL
jgi:hypothetical protein